MEWGDLSLSDSEDELPPLAGTLEDLLEKDTLKWIFVGGKGGVGKTTCSCSIATLLSQRRKSVLLISTDPAHNLSDAFEQKFTKEPAKVNGYDNLFAMEIDPEREFQEKDLLKEEKEGTMSMLKELSQSIPGIDEAMAFAEVMRLVKSMEFETIVFDTAPTGHTLRLLSFPTVIKKGMGMMGKFTGIMDMAQGMMGGAAGEESIKEKLLRTQESVEEIDRQFRDSALTTFVCVCIPEFLSVYETERLVQELTKYEIDVDNIIVNQILYPQKGTNCEFCLARVKMQGKYLAQIDDLYQDFHTVKLPLQKSEVRGADTIKSFCQHMLSPYEEKYNSQ